MVNSAKRAKRKRLAQEAQRRDASRSAHQMDPADLSGPGTDQDEQDDQEIMFAPRMKRADESPPAPERAQATTDCEIITMVKTLNATIAAVFEDTARMQRAYDQLRAENMARDKALANLSAMVKEYGSSPATMRPHPVIQSDVLDEEGNLHAADIGITWEGNETFLHGVRVVGPGQPRPAGMGPVMSTPYQPTREHDRDNTSAPLTVPDTEIQLCRPPQEIRQGNRPAAPIQRFNNKSLNWSAWFRHFRAVADVHGWSKDQRAYSWCLTWTRLP